MGPNRPEGWQLLRFGDLLTESRVPGSQGDDARRLSIKLYGNGVVPKINDRPGSSATKYYRRSSGQLIYSKLDFLNGAIGIIPESLDGYESTLDLPSFDIAPDVDRDWLVSVLTRPAFYRRYRFVAVGSRRARRVPVGEFLASVVTVPPSSEQRAIAGVLRTAARAVQDTEALIDRLRSAKHAIMRELLTLGHHDYRTTLVELPRPWRIGRVAPDVSNMPAHWKLVALADVARLESGHTPSRNHPEYWAGDIPWISLQDAYRFESLRICETDQTVGPLGIEHSSARVLPVSTVVLVRTGASLGRCTMLGAPMATSQGFANYVCGQRIDARYLLQVFRHMQREWTRLQAGSAIRDIYMPVFKKLQVLLPPMPEQQAIASVGETYDERIVTEQAYLEELRAAKRGLSQALLSGRVRVPAQGSDQKSRSRAAGRA